MPESSRTLNPVNEVESVHTPGYIQPHGLLLVLAEPDFRIVQISANTQQHLGCRPEQILGLPIGDILESGDLDRLRGCLEGQFEYLNPLDFVVTVADRSQSFQGVFHRSPSQHLILELEPVPPASANASTYFVDFYRLTKTPLQITHSTKTFPELCDAIVVELKRLTGFDRVMLYRFGDDRHGQVIAESREEHLEPFLGLHYPATDIPEAAARLFILNLVRLIPEVGYAPVPIVDLEGVGIPAIDNPAEQQALERAKTIDMSRCGLRGAVGCHCAYLQNMGVQATLTIALVVNHQLWGLIACHHYSPRHVPYMVRTACEFMGQTLALELVAREGQTFLEQKFQTQVLQSRILQALGTDGNHLKVLQTHQDTLMALAQATGFAFYGNETWYSVGQVPPEWYLRELLIWLPDRLDAQGAFVSHSLAQIYSPAQDFAAVASGLLALSITQTRPQYLLWFRPELPQTVTWAGKPTPQTQVHPNGNLHLTPRASFKAWQELVHQQARPWEDWILEATLAVRSHIISLLLRQADELAAFNLELQQSNAQLDTFTYIASHDLREPLRGIHNYATFLLEDYGSTLDAEGVDRLNTLVRLSRRMEDLINGLLRFSRLGRHNLHWSPIDWPEIIHEALDFLQINLQDADFELNIAPDLAPAQGDRSLIAEVIMNLIHNGLKYNDNTHRIIEIGSIPPPADRVPDSEERFSCFYVRDNGIGIRDRHQDSIFRIFKRLHGLNQYGGGTGVGLTIVKKIIEQHEGQIWIESVYGSGTTFYFTLPEP